MIQLLACTGTVIDSDPVEGHPGLDELAGVRVALDEGRVPRHGSDYLDPAVFWAQDLALEGDCQGALCARIATALVSPAGGDDGVLVIVDFEPEPNAEDLNLVLAVDASGSMGVDRMNAIRQGLGLRVGEMDSDDLAALVVFRDSPRTLRSPKPMDASERGRVSDALFLDPDGGTDVVAGLEAAFSEAAKNHGRGGLSRVLLVTDDPADTDALLHVARTRGAAGIGLTMVGAGNRLGGDLAWELERVPGGRMAFAELEDLEELLASSLVPAAQDLELEVRPAEGWEVVDSWLLGHSGSEALENAWLGSVFSGRARAFVVKPVEGDLTSLVEGTSLGSLQIGEDIVDVVAGDTDAYAFTTIHADTLGAFRFAALVDEALALEAAEGACSGTVDVFEAAALADEAAIRLLAAAGVLEDIEEDLGASLSREAERMTDLALVLVEEGC